METGKIHKLRMSPEEIEKFQIFLMERSGLVFEGRRIQEMERAVARRLIEIGISSFEEYYVYVTNRKQGAEELYNLAISLTVGETQFFRTPDQFAALRKYVFPELIERQRASGEHELRILSAGCATGEEPYSLCFLLDELIPDIAHWNITIRACDINRNFLEDAQTGIYGERKMRLVDPATRERYFERLAKNRYQVRDALKDRVEWLHFNITSDDYAQLTRATNFHVVLCRNVLIYFNLEIIRNTIGKIYNIINPEGYLMLGYSETLFKISDEFQSVHTPEAFFYQKTDKGRRPRHRELPKKPKPHSREELLQALGSMPHPLSDPARPRPAGTGAGMGVIKPITEVIIPAASPPIPRAERTEPAGARAGGRDKAAAIESLNEDELWEEALQLFSEERFDRAREYFEEMLKRDPCSARAHIGLGFLFANMGAEETSREHAEEARKYDDLMPEIYLLLALLDEKNGHFDRAVENYQRVIMLSPDFAMAHFNLANLYLKLKKHREARREFGNTINILENDRDNRSLRFSGGLSREAVIEFCRMQRDQIARPLPGRARAR